MPSERASVCACRVRHTSCSPPRFSHRRSSALCRTFLRNSLRRLSCAASRFWATGFGREGRAANLLWKAGRGAGTGEDWISRRMFGSRGESGGEVEGRMGLDDKGEDFTGRYGLDALKVGRALASSRKTGRAIVLSMVRLVWQ